MSRTDITRNYPATNQPIPWYVVFLKKVIVTQLLKKLNCWKTQRFIFVFTKARDWTQCWVCPSQSTSYIKEKADIHCSNRKSIKFECSGKVLIWSVWRFSKISERYRPQILARLRLCWDLVVFFNLARDAGIEHTLKWLSDASRIFSTINRL